MSGSIWNPSGFLNTVFASAINFLQRRTGAVTRTVQAKLEEQISVFDFMTSAQVAAVQEDDYTTVTYTEITAALNVAVSAFPKVSGVTKDMSIVFPRGTYRINGPINFPTGQLWYPFIKFEGRIFQTSATADALVFDQVFYGTITGVHCDTTWDAWANARSAIKFNTLANSELTINWATNFHKGLHLNANTPSITGITAYSEIHLFYMRENKYGVYGTPDGSATNFINANSFHGGSFQNANKATVSGDVGIYISGFNFGNSYYDQIFESMHSAFDLTNGIGILVVRPYFEVIDTWGVLSGVGSGTWIHGHQEFTPAKFVTNSQTRRLVFLSTGLASDGTIASQEIDSSGIRWKQYTAGDSSQNPSLTLGYQPYAALNCLTIDDHVGGSQQVNKNYTTSTNAPPTVGIFSPGAMCWNSTGTVGQPSGWMCYRLGTAGTLVGITGTVNLGSTDVTVNSAAGLKAGMYITVAGGAFAAGQISHISGNVVTMTSTSGANVAAVAVSYFPPLWRALANFV